MRTSACILLFAATLLAQPHRPGRPESSPDAFVNRMMAYDANRDGKLTRNEITDERLLELFERADSNHDGIVTSTELKALYIAESAWLENDRPPDRREGPGRGPRPDRGRGGPSPLRQQSPGQVLSESTQRALNLTPEQRASLAEIQREVDARLDGLLTPAQKSQLRQLDDRGSRNPYYER